MTLKELSKFGVNFGDNDFHYTFENLLPAIVKGMYENAMYYEKVDYLKTTDITKEYLAELLNKTATGFYYAVQNPLVYNKDRGFPVPYAYLSNIRPDQIYINEDLTVYIDKQGGDCNGELFCIEIYPNPNKDYGVGTNFFAL